MISQLDIIYLGNTKTPYLIIRKLPIDHCIVCLQDKPTTSHHLIPNRSGPKNSVLADLRVRICDDCNKLVHVENGAIDGFEIIKRQAKLLNKYKVDLKAVKLQDYAWLLEDIDKTRCRYIARIPKQIQALKDENNYRAIHPMLKTMEGRINELTRIEKMLKWWIHQNKIVRGKHEESC